MAAFVHEAAVHALLHRDLLFNSVLDFYARLHHDVRGDEVAGPTVALVDVARDEIVPSYILPVPAVRHILGIDLAGFNIDVLLCLGERLFELFRPIVELATFFRLGKVGLFFGRVEAIKVG